MSSASEQSKKRTRRRLRVSCVECTRRRQKCDRQQPCSSCIARKVEHLCRWELEPFARPLPARPPGHPSAIVAIASTSGSSGSHGLSPEPSDPPHPARSDPSTSPPATQIPLSSLAESDPRRSPPNPLDQDVKDAAITLAQLSVAHRGEYLGTGSLVCALYQLGDPDASRTRWQISAEVPHNNQSQNSLNVNLTNSFSSAIRALIASLPSKETCDTLFSNFLQYQNWRFTFPKDTISSSYSHMWEILSGDSASGADRVNIHWLTLLYAIFALAPSLSSAAPIPENGYPFLPDVEQERRTFFLHSLSGRRIAEDLFCVSSSVSSAPSTITEGASYGCLAVILLVQYMCDRGNVSEAWKMVGSAIRTAQTLGLHRDPDLYVTYANITMEEQKLRKSTWWLLLIQDRMLSFMLGRPVIVRIRDTDVPLPNALSGSMTLDRATDVDMLYQAYMARLSNILAECIEECFTLHPAPPDAYSSVENGFKEWEEGLPSFFTCRGADTSFDDLHPNLRFQRWMLAVHYYHCHMIFYRHLDSKNRALRIKDNPNKDKHILMALNLLRAERDIMAHSRNLRMNPQFNSFFETKQPCFSRTFCVFDGAVTLCIAILQDPNSPYADKWESEVRDAISLLEELQYADSGGIVRQALKVLRVLRKACRPATASQTQRATTAPSLADVDIILNPTPPSIEDILSLQDAGFSLMPDGFTNGWTGFDLLHNFQSDQSNANGL